MDLNKLERLQKLKDSGALTEDEFKEQKDALKSEVLTFKKTETIKEKQTPTFYMLMHLSQYANFFTPFAGTVIPLIMWLLYKDKDAKVDLHGRKVLNWQISLTLYFIISAILCLVIVGFLGLAALFIMSLVFPIMGGLKANDNEDYDYPLSIEFLSLKKVGKIEVEHKLLETA